MTLHDLQLWVQTLDLASPVLPASGLLWWARRLSWGLVLGALIISLWNLAGRRALLRGVPARSLSQLLVLVLVCALCLLPGGWSPAYWLGLAFQMPSLLSVALALHALNLAFDAPARTTWRSAFRRQAPQDLLNSPTGVAALLSVLGWVLLGDVLAWWPVDVYATGFHALTLALVAGLVSLTWVVWGRQTHGVWRWVMAALVLFVLTRWPTGNVWSALLDPLLWGLCQVWVLWRLWRYIKA